MVHMLLTIHLFIRSCIAFRYCLTVFFFIMQAVILVDPDSSIEVEKERQEYTICYKHT